MKPNEIKKALECCSEHEGCHNCPCKNECGEKAGLRDIGGTGGFSHEYEQIKSNYCPYCGAKNG